jgi:hypothetical protein
VRLNSDAQESDSTSVLSNPQENGTFEDTGPQHKAREVALSPLALPEELSPQHSHPIRPYTRPITPVNKNSVSTPYRTSPVKLNSNNGTPTSVQSHRPASWSTTSPSSTRKRNRRRGSASSIFSIDSPKDGGRGGIRVGLAQPAGSVVTTVSSSEGSHH